MSNIKALSIKNVFNDSLLYMRNNVKDMLLFSISHILLLIVGFEVLDGWHDVGFFFWLIVYYLYWYFFFRFYFKRKPYLFTNKMFSTLVPSTKILALTFIVLTVLLAIPLIPPFFSVGSEWANRYVMYLQIYMEDSRVVDTVTLAILIFVSPFIFYRPMMAWIASVIGRSGQMSSAFARTKGNYWNMVLIGGFSNLIFVALEIIGTTIGLGSWLVIVVGSPIIIYFNVVLGKIYEYFFLEIDA